MISADFPESSLKAARKFVEWMGHPLNEDFEELFYTLAVDLSNEFSSHAINYGVESAILSGRRLRLLDEIDHRKDTLNCGEVGVNLYLLFCAIGAEDRVDLLRIDPGVGSDHFGLLIKPADDYARSEFLDPLYNRMLEAIVTSKGLRLFGHPDADGKTEIGKNGTFIKTPVAVLDKQDVLRHIAYINSPLGFFGYYADGQKIWNKKAASMNTESSVRSIDDKLVLKVTCSDDSLDAYTRYRVYSGGSYTEGTNLHLKFSWVTEEDIVYREENGVPTIPQLPKTAKGLAFVAYLRETVRTRFSPEGTERSQRYLAELSDKLESLYSQKEALLEAHETILGPNERLITTFDGAEKPEGIEGLTESVRVLDLELIDLVQEHQREINSIISFYDHISEMEPTDRVRYLDHLQFLDDFRSRKVRPTRPYHSFAPTEDMTPVLEQYCASRARTFKGITDSFFSSPVVETVLMQYRQALDVKSIIMASSEVLVQAI